MSREIVLYDIPRPTADLRDKAWSPNAWKIRFSLNYKGLAHRTIWVEFPDIADMCKEIGAPPSSVDERGNPRYTIPVIHDLSTGAIVSESYAIAEYLDKTYPSLPLLIPDHCAGLQAMCQFVINDSVARYVLPAIILGIHDFLGEESKAYFRATREARMGKLEDVSPVGLKRDEDWTKVKRGLRRMGIWMSKNEGGQPFMMGDVASYADFVLAGLFKWIKAADDKAWINICRWDGGRWAKFMESIEKWTQVDQGIPYEKRKGKL